MEKYYYAEGNKQVGPVSFEELKGKIKPETKIWFEGLSDWKKASEIEELKVLFKVPPPINNNVPPPLKRKKIFSKKFLIWAISIFLVLVVLLFGKKKYDEGVENYAQEQRQMIEEEKKREVRDNWWKYIEVTHSKLTVGNFGGIDPFEISIKNNSNYFIDKISIKIEYVKANGQNYKKELVSGYDLKANGEIFIIAPSSNRGVDVFLSICYLTSYDLGIEYNAL